MKRALAALGVAAILALGGCSAVDDYPDATAQSLQEAVLAVSEASASGDWDEAQTALNDAAERLDAAIAAGEIGEVRASEITVAIAGVRADLEELIAAQQENDDQDDKPGNGNGNGPPDKDKDGKKD